MRTTILLISIMLLCTTAQAVIFDFESDTAGGFWTSDSQYGVSAGATFRIADHSSSTWGQPRSGSNVLICDWRIPFAGMIKFGFSTPEGFVANPIYSFGGYFSTQQDVVIQIIGYKDDIWNPVASVTIGAAGEAWNNRWAEISSAAGNINFLMFYSISSEDALLRYCADDVNVELVPEPSVLLALGAGLAGLVIRRKR